VDVDADRTRQRLLRYELLERLGSGAHGEGFLAQRVADGERVFIKVLKASLSEDVEWARRFADEVNLLRSCVHPNIVRYIETFRHPDGALCLVTEYLEGEDLHARLRKSGALPARHVMQLALPLCEALDYLHGRDVVHRDLTPSNILVSGRFPEVTPRLLDFGLAWSAGPRHAQTGAALGLTPQYAAPECLAGERATARSDLYSLGCILYQALSGAPPFVAGSAGELIELQRKGEIARLRGAAATLFPVIRRCLAADPEKRWGSAGELLRALQSAFEGAPADAAPISVAGMPPPPPVEATSLGTVGNYDLVRELGSGGMGKVYLARHSRLGRQVAIKMLRPEALADRDAVARFFMEARTVNAINHEHIVEIFDFVEEEGPPPRIYCVMELLVGDSLSKVRKSAPLPLERILHITRQVADALAAAHRAGVVHRDVKPANIMVTTRSGLRDYVKVLDFGVAKVNAALPGGGAPSVNTQTGLSLGTPDYMSPEQVTASAVDGRTDIFALGVLLYELIAGYRPFVGSNVAHLVVKVVREPHTPVPERTVFGDVVPPALKRLIDRCLEKDREARPQTMEEVSATLERLLQQHRSQAQSRLEAQSTVVEMPVAETGAAAAAHPHPANDTLAAPADFTVELARRPTVVASGPATVQQEAVATVVEAPRVVPPVAPPPPTVVEAPAQIGAPRPLPGWIWAAVPAALLVVGLLIFAILREAESPPPATAWRTPEGNLPLTADGTPPLMVGGAAPVPEVAPPPVTATPVPSEPEEVEVHLSLASRPEGARVVRVETGETLGTAPFEVKLPASQTPLRLSFALEGHLTQEVEVVLEGDAIERVIELKPEPPPPEPKRTRPVRRTRPAPKVDPNATLDPFALD